MTFKKDDAQKPRYDLIPPHAELELAHVLTMGAEKYGANNWHQGGPESKTRYIAAAQRHIAAYRRGETHDPESGRHHLAHAVASLMFVLEFECEDAGWIGDAVEDDTQHPVWHFCVGDHSFDVFRHQGHLFANLIHKGRQVCHVSSFDDVKEGLRRALEKVPAHTPEREFMANAIAAYEREIGEVEVDAKKLPPWNYIMKGSNMKATVRHDGDLYVATLLGGSDRTIHRDASEDDRKAIRLLRASTSHGSPEALFMGYAVDAYRRRTR